MGISQSNNVNNNKSINRLTFRVDDVKQPKISRDLLSSSQIRNNFCKQTSHLKEYIESCGIKENDNRKWIDINSHGFFGGALYAFSNHYPFAISPDHIFQTILEGWSIHVEKHSEELRKCFVSHKDKKKIEVRRDDFIKGSDNNPWSELFEEFAQKIKIQTNPSLYDTVNDGKFSTTDINAIISRNISLMSLTKHYFDFSFTTSCGFPSITLIGEKEDWILLKNKVDKMKSFMTSDFANKWIPALHSILDKFVDSYDNKVDKFFWSSMVKYASTSGSGADTYISGWINVLFPYLSEKTNNDYCLEWNKLKNIIKQVDIKKQIVGNSESSFDRFFCTSPVIWNYFDEKYNLLFKTGFIGCYQEDDGTIIPQISWSVIEEVIIPKTKNCNCMECIYIK
jgi:hypothetical protein